MRLRFLLVAALAFGSLYNSSASAQVGVRVYDVGTNPPRVDGMLREWRHIRRVRVGRGDDAAMRFALGFSDAGLYLGATVRDERLVRGSGRSRLEDAIVLTLAVPGRRGLVAREFWIYPGVQGTSGAAASGGLRGRLRPLGGAEVVESRQRGGYEIEAFIPAAALGRRWQEGRLAIRLSDVDRETRPEVENTPATAVVDPAHLETLPVLVMEGGTQGPLQQFLRAQGIGAASPNRTVRGNVAGDGQPEQIAQVGRFVVVYGPGYRGGSGFDFAALPIETGGDVREFSLRDFTGDGREELLVVMRQRSAAGSRDLWQLFSFPGESVVPLFGIEIRKQTAAGSVESTVRVRARGRRAIPSITVTAGRARGLSAANFQEAAATDARPILLPWGPVLSRSYRWDGSHFAVGRERANPHPQTSSSPAEPASASPASASASAPASVVQLVAAVRQRLHIPRRTRARFVTDINVAENRTPEHVEVLGNALVVVGQSFRGGAGYFHYNIPENAGRLTDVSAADLTGDGRAEILIRGVQQLGEVQRELLMVHRFTRDGSFPRILTVEVSREQDGHRLVNDVRTRGGRLEIRPGRATGWDRSSWPWSDEVSPGIEPLLLPWRDQNRRYRFRDGQLR